MHCQGGHAQDHLSTEATHNGHKHALPNTGGLGPSVDSEVEGKGAGSLLKLARTVKPFASEQPKRAPTIQQHVVGIPPFPPGPPIEDDESRPVAAGPAAGPTPGKFEGGAPARLGAGVSEHKGEQTERASTNFKGDVDGVREEGGKVRSCRAFSGMAR